MNSDLIDEDDEYIICAGNTLFSEINSSSTLESKEVPKSIDEYQKRMSIHRMEQRARELKGTAPK